MAVAPGGLTFRDDRRTSALRALVLDCGDWIELPAEAFKASGTGVQTVLLWMDA